VRCFAPYAAGSGISEIKVIIAGFTMKGFLGFTTYLLYPFHLQFYSTMLNFSSLAIKTITLPLAIASGLSIGKEGPSVHVAVSLGNTISSLFNLSRSAFTMREIYTASSAAGVAVAFGAPIGGVIFSLEEMMSFAGATGMVVGRGFLMALVACMVVGGMDPFWTGGLVMFEVHYERDWHFFEVLSLSPFAPLPPLSHPPLSFVL
jgi:chloride channel 3/4/5